MKVPALRAHRIRAVLSQAELAEKAGVSEPSITRLEGGGDARPSTIRKIAKALNVEPQELTKSAE